MEKGELLGKFESGEMTDLGTYIRLHKNITLPNSEAIDENTKKYLLDNKGSFIHLEIRGWLKENETGEGDKKLKYVLEYIDKDGNLSNIDIVINDIIDLNEKIIESKEYNVDKQKEIIKANLLSLGFKNWYESYSEEELKEAEEGAKKDINNDSKTGYPLNNVNKAEIEKHLKERIKDRLNYYIRKPKLQKILDAQKAYQKRLEKIEISKKEEGFNF